MLPVVCGCSVSKFTIIDEDINKVRTAAIIYEKDESERPESLINECTQSFKKYIEESGIEVINFNDKQGAVSPEMLQKAIDSGDFSKIKTPGIDAFFIYKINDFREEKRIGFRKKRTDGFMISSSVSSGKRRLSDSEEEIIEIKTFYFRIDVRMIQSSSGKILLSAQNTMTKATDELGVYESLDSFKRYILNELGKEIKQTITLSSK